MRIHKAVSKIAHGILSIIVDAASDEQSPVFVAPGTFDGRPATVIFLSDDRPGNEVALAPVALILNPEDVDRVTIDGLGGTPSAAPVPAVAATDEVLGFVRALATGEYAPDLAAARARALVERMAPAAPAAPAISTGVYL